MPGHSTSDVSRLDLLRFRVLLLFKREELDPVGIKGREPVVLRTKSPETSETLNVVVGGA